MGGGDQGGRGAKDGRRGRGQHLVDQRGLQRSLDAAAHQVAERDLEDVLARQLTWGARERESKGARTEEEFGGRKSLLFMEKERVEEFIKQNPTKGNRVRERLLMYDTCSAHCV